MNASYKQFGKNGDETITAGDIQIYLEGIGLDMAKELLKTVDKNENDLLDFTDLMPLSAMINKSTGSNAQ
ncbi:unnamed protein product [Adineta ricciae]|uniref:EF-hand domain-containing protein n=1 Tax=Adineta ricciae TaxID=249248 RepID=A0A815NIS9_ADIRI|nr:unnamed protein product [Adineta ricciae]